MCSDVVKFSSAFANLLTVLQLKSETTLKAVRHRNHVVCIGDRIESISISFIPALQPSTAQNVIALCATGDGKL
jgi:hypothetical protein